MGRDINFGLGIDFNPGLQDGLINNRGVEMIHEIGVSCTCRGGDVYSSTQNDGSESRQEPFCPRCGQDGWIYRNPRLVTGIITGIRHQRNILDAGLFGPGDATFSPRPSDSSCGEDSVRIGSFDKLTATWPEPVDDGQVIVRGAGSKARTQGIDTKLETNEDRLWYEPAQAIWCEDEFGNIYKEVSDFELGPGRIIRWIGNRPHEGSRYSIKYEAYFEWISWQPPGERVDRGGKNLGELVYLRKRHIKFVNSSPFATSEDKQSILSRLDNSLQTSISL